MKRDLEFLFEIGTLRYLGRTWRQFLNPNFANVAEHTLRVVWIALLLAKMEKADMNKVMKMALFHDITESRTGDVHYVSRMYTERHEDSALADMLKDVAIADEVAPIWHEYEDKESLEAKIVKDADNLDVDLELREQELQGYDATAFMRDGLKKSGRAPLYTASAQKLWKLIYKSNPHDWHRLGVNRFTKGDWKTGTGKKKRA